MISRHVAIQLKKRATIKPRQFKLSDLRQLKLCELRGANWHEFVFVQNDASCSANQLPPLAGRADHNREHQHEKESRNKRIESSDPCLSSQLSSLVCIGQFRRLTQK